MRMPETTDAVVAITADESSSPHPPVSVDDVSCSICLDTLYKPCVNSCGHTFCFWCFHHSMDVLRTQHHCPLCRAEFRHFPAVCVPLHRYLFKTFPSIMAERAEQTQTLETNEYHAESPAIQQQSQEALLLLEAKGAFQCVDCGNIACPPTVLSCGHIVCCNTGSSSSTSLALQRRKCPLENCVGTAPVGATSSAVCHLIDKVLRGTMSSEKYQEAVALSSRQCNPPPTAQGHDDTTVEIPNETKDEKKPLAPGDIVVLHDLSSVAGARLNGRRAKIQSYHSAINRYAVELLSPDGDTTNHHPVVVSVKEDNLEREPSPKEELHVHYGVGCDGCGLYPIAGRRYRCNDCSEEIGFDLCGSCHDDGLHKRADSAIGRFNQQHTPEHRLSEVIPNNTFLQQLQHANPGIPLHQLMEMLESSPS